MALILVDKKELLEHAYRDKLDSRELIAKMIDNAPAVKAVSTKDIEMLLKGMRISIGNQSKEIESIYGQGTGWRDYFVGFVSAISYIEGWLAEK